ncbi:hypothetical protein CKM354_000458800 [Cercospora kikuchii]|uniref:Uncharacterized protein n=1 Tax=Cercospora kikuchii TaxID=84275 RepID=A0A9P3CEG5_9PEZI|nr:uncharacterized protein CKM354_000458800 [Cercospora kikuchii]GIZ41276.1 hypothetical protein CKM354_000458800 [Cercospora kikuchii]
MKFSTVAALAVYAGTAVCTASEVDEAVKSFITVTKSNFHDAKPGNKSTLASAVDTENISKHNTLYKCGEVFTGTQSMHASQVHCHESSVVTKTLNLGSAAPTAPHLTTRVVEHEKEPVSTSSSSTPAPTNAYGLDDPKRACPLGLIKECEYHHPASAITTSLKHCWCEPEKVMPTTAL